MVQNIIYLSGFFIKNAIGWSVVCMSIRYYELIVLFRTSISFMIFCLVVQLLKGGDVKVSLCIFLFLLLALSILFYVF